MEYVKEEEGEKAVGRLGCKEQTPVVIIIHPPPGRSERE